MPSQSTPPKATGRRLWVIALTVVAATLLVLAGQPAWAANGPVEINQGTVPEPTPTAAVPTPTQEDDNNNQDNPPAQPTATPAPAEPAPGEPAPAALTASVNAVTLNVRQGPSTDFPVIGRLAQSTVITVEGRNEASDWWVVCCVPDTDTRGWVSAGLVTPNFTTEQAAALPVVAAPEVVATATITATPAAPVVTATPVPGSKPGSVTAVTLNVRSGPATTNNVVGKLREGDVVSVLGRNEAGDWLFVCCVPNSETRGWVSAEFIAPTFAPADLEVSAGGEGTPAEATATPEATEETTGTAEAGAASPLVVSIMQLPPFAVQGREIVLLYSVRNTGSAEATNVVLTSELPGPLTLISAAASGEGQVAPQDAASPATVSVTWPALPANDAVTATVRVRVAADVPNGTTFPDLATVSADGGLSAVGGIRIGMPPALLPEFW